MALFAQRLMHADNLVALEAIETSAVAVIYDAANVMNDYRSVLQSLIQFNKQPEICSDCCHKTIESHDTLVSTWVLYRDPALQFVLQHSD
jgi:hypothetical protein